jgi:hypothetical protein
MFKKLKIDTALFLTIVFALGLIAFFSFAYYQERMRMKEDTTDVAYHAPDEEKLTHIDSLPHYQYKLIYDSLQKVANMVKDRNTLSVFSRISTGFIGALKTSSYWYDWYGDHKSHLDPNYYMSIPGYDMNPQYQFEYRDHKNFLIKNQSDTTEIKVAYLPRVKTVLIPVSESAYTITRNCLFILMAIFTLAALYIGIGLPISILVNISGGNVFTRKNIRNLYILAYGTLGYMLIQLVMPYLVCLFLLKKIPDAFVISFWNVFVSQGWNLLVGTILLAIASAFAKGYKLQQEQDLTI